MGGRFRDRIPQSRILPIKAPGYGCGGGSVIEGYRS